MKRGFALLTGFVLIVLVVAYGVRAEQEEGQASIMEMKLDLSQRLLEGLAVEDYELVGKNAAGLQELSKLEAWTKAWEGGDSPRYRAQLDAFSFAAEYLAEQAKAKNIDGVTVAYMQLTLSCVNCHKEMRQ